MCPRHSLDYACGDFDLTLKPGKISHVLMIKAILEAPLIVQVGFGRIAGFVRSKCLFKAFIWKTLDYDS
jgi:hypothetical protein